ncbi:MAG: hypothetical protein GXO39_05250 [Thermotogae bacterium]|nr:hypothetical protein [Thermotogota bacterium]
MKVAVIGDVMLDEYAFGKVERISPEAPVPVFNYVSSKFLPGGAANVALNLARLGVHVHLYGIVGEDSDGDEVELLCRSVNVVPRFLRSKLRTLKKTRLISKYHHVLRIDYEEKFLADEALELLNIFRPRDYDAVVVSNYDKGTIVSETLHFMRENFPHVLKAIDPKSLFWESGGFDLIKPNLSELRKAMNMPLEDIDEVKEAAEKAYEKLKVKAVVATMGDRGMWVISNEGEFYIPALKRDVIDITGAGDTVLAWVVWARLQGYSWKESGELASRAAAITVSKLGAYAPTYEEVK